MGFYSWRRAALAFATVSSRGALRPARCGEHSSAEAFLQGSLGARCGCQPAAVGTVDSPALPFPVAATDCRVPPSLALGTVCLEEHVGMLKWLTGTQDLPVGVKFSRH